MIRTPNYGDQRPPESIGRTILLTTEFECCFSFVLVDAFYRGTAARFDDLPHTAIIKAFVTSIFKYRCFIIITVSLFL